MKTCTLLLVMSFLAKTPWAQESERKIRIAKIEIVPAYMEQYKTALAVHAKKAVELEPGVLALQAVYDKAHPTSVTVFEIYASEAAYQLHLKAPHFIKYKSETLAWSDPWNWWKYHR